MPEPIDPRRVHERTALLDVSFATLVLQQLAFGFSFSTFFLLPKFFAERLASSPSEIGLVTAMYGFSGILAVPFVAFGIDRVSRVVFLRAGSALMGMAAIAFVAVDRAGALASALRFSQGFAWSMVFTAGLAWASDAAPPARLAQALGIVGGTNLLMNAVAPAVLEPVADRYGYVAIFTLAAVAALFAVAVTFRLAEPSGRAAPSGGSVIACLRSPKTLLFAPVLASAGIAYGVMFTFAQPFALARELRAMSGFFVAYTAGALFVRFALGGLGDRVGRRAVAMVALVSYGGAVIAMCALTTLGLPLIGGVFGVAHGFFVPAINALIVEGERPSERGKVIAIANGCFSAGCAAVLGFGVVIERTGYEPVFAFAGACTILGALLLLGWPRVARVADSAR